MVHVACCFDARYEIPFAALVNSIDRHATTDITVHAFHDGPLENARSTVKGSKRLRIEFRDIGNRISRYRAFAKHTRCVFAKLHLHELLADVDRVIYLDTDMIVLRDLADLAKVDLQGNPVAAVIDFPLVQGAERRVTLDGEGVRWRADEYISGFLGLKHADRYFNTGLLVIDLARFSASGATERAYRFLVQQNHRCIFNDQDALNVVLADNVEFLDPRWNCYCGLFKRGEDSQTSEEIRLVLKLYDEPWIIHFAGRKPWNSVGRRGKWDKFFWESLIRHRIAATAPGNALDADVP
jgi:lipopolysaccharide biosynthesis glycosyltransferase